MFLQFTVPGSPSIANERVVMATQAMNLLGTLLSFSSIVLQNIKGYIHNTFWDLNNTIKIEKNVLAQGFYLLKKL